MNIWEIFKIDFFFRLSMWHLLHSYFQNSALYVRSIRDNAVEKKIKSLPQGVAFTLRKKILKQQIIM